MADIHLYTDSSSQLTSVSNIFIDEFMPDANGEFVKVYLYLLRCIGSNAQNCTISEILNDWTAFDADNLRYVRSQNNCGRCDRRTVLCAVGSL